MITQGVLLKLKLAILRATVTKRAKNQFGKALENERELQNVKKSKWRDESILVQNIHMIFGNAEQYQGSIRNTFIKAIITAFPRKALIRNRIKMENRNKCQEENSVNACSNKAALSNILAQNENAAKTTLKSVLPNVDGCMDEDIPSTSNKCRAQLSEILATEVNNAKVASESKVHSEDSKKINKNEDGRKQSELKEKAANVQTVDGDFYREKPCTPENQIADILAWLKMCKNLISEENVHSQELFDDYETMANSFDDSEEDCQVDHFYVRERPRPSKTHQNEQLDSQMPSTSKKCFVEPLDLKKSKVQNDGESKGKSSISGEEVDSNNLYKNLEPSTSKNHKDGPVDCKKRMKAKSVSSGFYDAESDEDTYKVRKISPSKNRKSCSVNDLDSMLKIVIVDESNKKPTMSSTSEIEIKKNDSYSSLLAICGGSNLGSDDSNRMTVPTMHDSISGYGSENDISNSNKRWKIGTPNNESDQNISIDCYNMPEQQEYIDCNNNVITHNEYDNDLRLLDALYDSDSEQTISILDTTPVWISDSLSDYDNNLN